MPARRSRAVAAVVLALAAVSTSTPSGAGAASSHSPAALPPRVEAAVDRDARRWIADGHAVGVAVEVVRDGRVVFARGYGTTAPAGGAPVTPQTMFRVGSLTKQFTAAAILRLAQEGRLSVDDRLSKYFPAFPRGDEVTLRELLNQTSGIHDYTEVAIDEATIRAFTTDHTTVDWVEHIARQTPLYDFAPGSAWHYSNSGYYLLGAIVEQVSHESLASYLQRSFFAPLGMASTAIDGNEIEGPGRAQGFDRQEGPGPRFKPSVYLSMTVPGGAGALRTSADDLVRWNRALFTDKVLGGAARTAMMTPGHLADGRLSGSHRVATPPSEPHTEYGFGLRIGRLVGDLEIGHEGDIFGFNAAMDTYPAARTTVVVLANTPHGAYDLEKRIARQVLHAARASAR